MNNNCSLYPYRGRCRYRQYMPSKPARHGLKFWLACDSENYYCCNLQFYCGKDETRDLPLGEHVVLSLTDFLKNSGRNVTCDNFFTSLTLAQKLRVRGMTIVGTVRGNRRELPRQVTSTLHRPLYSMTQATNNDDENCKVLLVSYMAKKNRVVNLMSTTHRKSIAETTEKQKPDVILYYNQTKGGVDAADERLMTYTVKFKTRRWHVVVFCNILDMSAFNGFVVHSLFDPQWNSKKLHRRRLFLLELGNELIAAHIQRRCQSHHQLSIVDPIGIVHAQKRGLCARCKENRKKCTARCAACKCFVCKDHVKQICEVCANT